MKASAEFRQGWPIILTALVGSGLGVSSITLYTAGLFVTPLEQAAGWSRAAVSAGSVASTLGIAVASPFVGRLIDQLGARPVATLSLLAVALAHVALGLAPLSLPVFYGLIFLMGVLGSGSTPVAFTRVVSAWFTQARGLALGITLMGSGLIGVLAPQILGPLIQTSGWRAGYLGLGVVIALAVPLVWWRLRDPALPAGDTAALPPAATGVEFRDTLRNRALWTIGGAFLFAALPITGTVVHFVPILTDAGLDRMAAVQGASILGFSVILSRLCTGLALDRVPAPLVGAVVFAAAAGGCALLWQLGAGWSLAAGFLVSFALGTEVDLLAFMVARYFGLRAYGRVFGLLFALMLLSSGAGPVLFGALFDHAGTYGPALGLGAASLLMSALLMLLTPRRPAIPR